MPKQIRCKECNQVIGQYDEYGNAYYNGRTVMVPVTKSILCKGKDPKHPCNTVNYIEPEKLIMRDF
jgi:hypothetical protein